jgi:hypothetical protein
MRFYLRHVFHSVSTRRRLAGRLLEVCPAPALLGVFPSFWAVGGKQSRPPEVPTVVLGTAEGNHVMKTIDWEHERFVAIDRRDRRRVSSSALIEGWSARRWLTWPLLERTRRRRVRDLLARAGALLTAAERRPFAPDDQRAAVEQAERALTASGVPEPIRAALRDELSELQPLPAVREHGDLALGNLIVTGEELVAVDLPERDAFGPPGLDACAIAFDALSALAGEKQLHLETVLRCLAADADISSFLAKFLETRDARLAMRLVLLAVLRHAALRSPWAGTDALLMAAADGRLLAVLSAAGFAPG